MKTCSHKYMCRAGLADRPIGVWSSPGFSCQPIKGSCSEAELCFCSHRHQVFSQSQPGWRLESFTTPDAPPSFLLVGALGWEESSGGFQSCHQALPPAPPGTGGTQENMGERKKWPFYFHKAVFKHSGSAGGGLVAAKAISLLCFACSSNVGESITSREQLEKKIK